MNSIKRILLIDKQARKSFETALVLRLAGYQVECCEETELAINRYQLYLKTDEPFDLLLAVVDDADRKILEECYRAGKIGLLGFLQRHLSCPHLFCRLGRLINLCHPAALLGCIQELQSSAREQQLKVHKMGSEEAFQLCAQER